MTLIYLKSLLIILIDLSENPHLIKMLIIYNLL